MFRRTLVISSAFLMAMVLAGPAMAGFRGGTIVRIDHGPGEFIAGETFDLMYTQLWMGDTPVTGGSVIELRPVKGTEGPAGGLRFEATPTKTPGQYLARITVPSEGTWQWAATHSRGFTDLGTMEVAPMTLTTVLNRDVVALVLAVAATAALARFVSKTKLEPGGRVLDNLPQISPEGA